MTLELAPHSGRPAELTASRLRRKLRVDIQVLRGTAVMLVLLFHAGLPWLPGGYLGVDIFFVISGYLVTGMIAQATAEGSFTFARFYLNRAKRLLPAAYTVYLATGALGLWLLTDSEVDRYLETLFGALSFTANIQLWQGTNYFSSTAKLNVLLHSWSLSVEEQFYIIFPLVIVFAPRRYLLPIMVLGFFLSIMLCFIMVSRSPVATFYLLPTRAWELTIGAIVALGEDRLNASGKRRIARLGVPAVALCLLVPIFMPGEALGIPHPGLDAVAVCLATAAIIAGRPQFMNEGILLTGPGYWLGNISYSLYLVHWPLFSFARNVYLGDPVPSLVRLSLLVVSILLAAALHYTVEKPIHAWRPAGRTIISGAAAVAATVTVWLSAVGIQYMRENPRDYARLVRPNFGLDESCNYSGGFHPEPQCQTAQSPKTLVWGDSFAMHLVHALPDHTRPLIQATMSGCAPAMGLAQINPAAGQDASWAEACIAFNDDVLRYLREHEEIETVIVSSVFNQILGATKAGIVREGGILTQSKMDFELGASRYLDTFIKITRMGRRVVVIGPTPSIGTDMAACLERREMRLLTLGKNSSCELRYAAAREYRKSATAILDRIIDISGIRVIDLFDVLCADEVCKLKIDDTWIFRDAGHLSVLGSQLLASKKLLRVPE